MPDREPVPEVPGLAPGSPVVRGGHRRSDLRGPPQEAPRSAHEALAIYAQDPRASDEPGPWRTLADRVDGRREGPGSRRMLRPAPDAHRRRRTPARACGSSTGRSGFARRRRPPTTFAAPIASAGRATPGPRSRDREPAEQIQPETALDYFLNGRELASRGRVRPRPSVPRPAVRARSRSDLGPPPAGRLRPQHATEASERGQDQPRRLHQEPIRDLVGLYLLRASSPAKKAQPGSRAQEAAETPSRPPRPTTATPWS